MRILLLSNMYPSAERPEYGVFVSDLADALRDRGHDIDEAVLRAGRGGLARYGLLAERALREARHHPDVIYAHYLVPTGLVAWAASRASGAPYVITAHGRDVRNAQSSGVLGRLTGMVLRHSAATIAVSDYLAGQLPPGASVVESIDCGVDTERFTADGWEAGEGPRFLFVGSLIERKNVARLLEAFETIGRGALTVVGDGPLRAQLAAIAPPGVRFTGRLDRAAVTAELHRADALVVPSLIEPQGQVVLEALACGVPVVATRVGGPSEVVTEACGALVDPLDVESIAGGMLLALELPVPCPAAVEVAADHDRRRQAERIEAVLMAAVESRATRSRK